MPDKIYFELHQAPGYRQPTFQLSIGTEKSGYRIAGPKFDGSSRSLQKHEITASNAAEIRNYLDRAFPLLKL